MFAIHSPQSITLHTDDADRDNAQDILINFSTDGANTSRCKLELVVDGATFIALFNTRGMLVDQSYKGPDDNPDPEAPAVNPADFIVDGRDIRADNPYTHVAPVDADTAYRDGQTPGRKHPIPLDADGKPVLDEKAESEKAHREAADRADKARAEREKLANETPEERTKRLADERKAREDRAAKSLKQPAKADRIEQAGEPARNADGSVAGIAPEPSRDPGHYDPLVPAASSPLPGSPPPHRIDSANPTHSNVTGSGQMTGPGPFVTPDPRDNAGAP